MIVCPLHLHTDSVRMVDVVDEMRRRGAPVLRGYVDDGVVLLREGTHRINAAAQLGLVPKIVSVPWWRSSQALANARVAAARRGLVFENVEIV